MIEGLLQRENYVLAKKLLDVSHAKQQAFASNLANVETPGYKRIEVDKTFEARLRKVAASDDIQAIDAMRIVTDVDEKSPSVRPDGNNVQIDQELMRLQKNAVQYQFLANYTSNSLNRLKTAISGRLQ